METLNFRQSIIGRAARETKQVIETWQFWAAEVVMVSAASIVAAASVSTSANQLTQAVTTVFAIIGGLLSVIVLVFVVWLILAPRKQRDEFKRYGEDWAAKAKPKLAVENPSAENMDEIGGKGWGLYVRNKSNVTAHHCRIVLEDMLGGTEEENSALRSFPFPRDLHWAGQEGDQYFDIAPQLPAIANVLDHGSRSDGIGYSPEYWIAYKGSNDFRRRHKLEMFTVGYFLISLSCDDTLPTYVVCRHTLDGPLLPPRSDYEVLYRGDERPDFNSIVETDILEFQEARQEIIERLDPNTEGEGHAPIL